MDSIIFVLAAHRQASKLPTKPNGLDYLMELNSNDTALVVIDPQNDVLSEKGVSWALVGDERQGKQHGRESRPTLCCRKGA